MNAIPPPEETMTHGNPEAEWRLLGALMVDNRALAKVAHLKAEDFCLGLHGRMYAACKLLVERGQKADPITLRPFFDNDPELASAGGQSFIARMVTDSVDTLAAPNYARTIADMSVRRKLTAILCDHRERALDGSYSTPTDQLIADLQKDLKGTEGHHSTVNIQTRREVMTAVIEDMKGPRPADSTGIRPLDIAMGGGGLLPGRSYGVAARMKQGKTTLLGTISYNLNERKIPHLYIAGEMTAKELEHRNMARALKVDSLRFLRPDRDLHMKAAEYALQSAPTGGTHYLTAPGITFDHLKRAFAVAVSKWRVRGVIFDYLQLTQGKPRGQSTAEFFDEVSQWIANTSRETGVWSIVSCQLNQDDNVRGGESLRFAFDQVYKLRRLTDDSPEAWLEMVNTRYTGFAHVGSEAAPALFLEDFGPYFREASR